MEVGEDSQPVQMRRVAALMAECEDAITSDSVAEARRTHLEKLHEHQRRSHECPLTRRWVDTLHDDGARKARWTTREYEQTLNGNEDFFSRNASDDAPQNNFGRGSGTFQQSLLTPDGTACQVWIEPLSEEELGPNST